MGGGIDLYRGMGSRGNSSRIRAGEHQGKVRGRGSSIHHWSRSEHRITQRRRVQHKSRFFSTANERTYNIGIQDQPSGG
jgi:allophanate hydrolase subunit 2